MTSLAADVAVAIALFIATNIDDIFILLAFLADPRFRARNVVVGQFIGMAALVLVSVLAGLISLVIPRPYVGLLGLIPIAMGVKQLWDLRAGETDDDAMEPFREGRAQGQVLSVAAVTIANGGDNVGIYTPVFAVASSAQTLLIVAVFVLMTVLWCAFAQWLVNHPTIGGVIKRYGHRVLPFVLIGLGVTILLEV